MSNAPAQSKPPTPAAPPVWVINRENCIRILAYYGAPAGDVDGVEVAVRTKRVIKARCFAGLNLMDAETAKACGIGGAPGLDPCATSGGRLINKRPTALDDGAAIDIAMITASKRALRAWRELEAKADQPRAEVIKAIDEKLANTRPDAGDEKD
jgi:hypothetical protein